jgi:cytochrome c biogenesis protein CcmG, thiol:disulfide interchange protein DsbE
MKCLFVLFSFILLAIFSNAQSNIAVFYQEKGKLRIYTPDEFQNLKVVDSVKSSKITMEIKPVILDCSIRDGKKIIVFDIKFSFKDSKGTVQIMLDKAYALKGQYFPDFNAKDILGKSYSLKDFKGKPTLVNFWFHTCGPCKAEIPVLNKIMEHYGDKINFVALTYDSKELIQPILDERPFNFIQLINAGDVVNQLNLKAAPKNIFLDKNGIIQQVYDGVDIVYNSMN